MNNYPLLNSEIECINNHLGTTGILDALEYINHYKDEYEGTAVYREFNAFCRSMRALFAPAEV